MNARWLPLLVFFAVPLATGIALALKPATTVSDPVDFGRQVYVAEGCIHCHSQYVRPNVVSDRFFGEPASTEFPRHQAPVLIGNRRQGPDLMNVGTRRTAQWQRLHLIDPQFVSPGSLMPSYAHLFTPENADRGAALVTYLGSLGLEHEAAFAGTSSPTSGIASTDEAAEDRALPMR